MSTRVTSGVELASSSNPCVTILKSVFLFRHKYYPIQENQALLGKRGTGSLWICHSLSEAQALSSAAALKLHAVRLFSRIAEICSGLLTCSASKKEGHFTNRSCAWDVRLLPCENSQIRRIMLCACERSGQSRAQREKGTNVRVWF